MTENRKAESAWVKDANRQCLPVILEQADRSDLPDINGKMKPIPHDKSVAWLVEQIWVWLQVGPGKAIHLFVVTRAQLCNRTSPVCPAAGGLRFHVWTIYSCSGLRSG
ncbi:hypothetical protein Droror1_Dr00014784 [Drosera rotundifolia]